MANPKLRSEDLTVTRTFDVPRERVWKARTDPEQVMRWWGPNYFSSPFCKLDFREGGTSLVCMRSPDGVDMYTTWAYSKIVPLERIEFIQNVSDRDGKMLDPASLGLREDFPKNVRTVVTFKAVGDKTEMTVSEYCFPDSEMFKLAELGLNQSLDKMAASLT